MWRWLFIGFLIAHGLIHIAVWATPKPEQQSSPFEATHSWLLGDQRSLAAALAYAAMGLFVIAGLGLLFHAGWWRPVTVVASGLSLALASLFFNPWLLMAIGLNAGLIAGIVWLSWPSQAMVGA